MKTILLTRLLLGSMCDLGPGVAELLRQEEDGLAGAAAHHHHPELGVKWSRALRINRKDYCAAKT